MKILFQGDSVTATRRNREADTLGEGYALMVSGDLGEREPGCHTFINRGIGGNRIVDVYARMKSDIWNLNPDFMSFLIGVNDVWHDLDYQNGVEAERYEKIYRMLLEDTMAACPNLKMMLMEPFALSGTGTEKKWDIFSVEIAKRAEITHRLAEQYHIPIIPLQEIFNRACDRAPANCWLVDGVHPTAAGHRLIANAWLNAYDGIMHHV